MLGKIDRWAVVAQLVKVIRMNQGWAGETHIQKTLFFLQELLQVPTGYDFVLYKHGPYDFDLHDDLGTMLTNSILALDHQPLYGPRFRVGKLGDKVIQLGNHVVDQYKGEIKFVADTLGDKDVRELERLGTALLLKKQFPLLAQANLSSKLVELKPHVQERLASVAVREVFKIEEDAKAEGLIDK